MNASFSQRCKNEANTPQGHCDKRGDPNETASYGRAYRLYHCARADYVSVGNARSNTLGARRIIG
jgi:hypothetical protein